MITKVTGNLPFSNFDISCFNSLPDIPMADSEFYRNSMIDKLIACELLSLIMSSCLRRNICASLLAQETVFGWVLIGPVCPFLHFRPQFQSISRFWEFEEPLKRFSSDDDRYCEDYFIKPTTRNTDGQYVVSLPQESQLGGLVEKSHFESGL